MQKIGEYLFLGGLGGALYYTFEVVFRGYSHFSMFLLGGICFLFCGLQNEGEGRNCSLFKQVIVCDIFVLSWEFMTGILVNKILHWNVWDYGNLPFNLWGQISLTFAFVFAVLCFVGIILDDYIRYWLFNGAKPDYRKHKQ